MQLSTAAIITIKRVADWPRRPAGMAKGQIRKAACGFRSPPERYSSLCAGPCSDITFQTSIQTSAPSLHFLDLHLRINYALTSVAGLPDPKACVVVRSRVFPHAETTSRFGRTTISSSPSHPPKTSNWHRLVQYCRAYASGHHLIVRH